MRRRWHPAETGERHGQHTLSAARIQLELMFKKGALCCKPVKFRSASIIFSKTISDTSRTCHADKSIPTDLMDSRDKLDKECQSAKKVMSSNNEDRIRRCVDDLERMGDRADRACQQAARLDARI